jgi:hypothetical protein
MGLHQMRHSTFNLPQNSKTGSSKTVEEVFRVKFRRFSFSKSNSEPAARLTRYLIFHPTAALKNSRFFLRRFFHGSLV